MKKVTLIIAAMALMSFTTIMNLKGDKTKDIVDVALSAENLSTLVTAVTAADLVSALKGEGPFTVFAPTNKAFAKVDKEVLASLLRPENKKTLSSILTYHVVSGKYDAKKLKEEFKKKGGTIELKTLNGQIIKIRKGTDGIYLKDGKTNYSKILTTDITASNGVIHTINKVAMPK